jgi:hypothetical protein
VGPQNGVAAKPFNDRGGRLPDFETLRAFHSKFLPASCR